MGSAVDKLLGKSKAAPTSTPKKGSAVERLLSQSKTTPLPSPVVPKVSKPEQMRNPPKEGIGGQLGATPRQQLSPVWRGDIAPRQPEPKEKNMTWETVKQFPGALKEALTTKKGIKQVGSNFVDITAKPFKTIGELAAVGDQAKNISDANATLSKSQMQIIPKLKSAKTQEEFNKWATQYQNLEKQKSLVGDVNESVNKIPLQLIGENVLFALQFAGAGQASTVARSAASTGAKGAIKTFIQGAKTTVPLAFTYGSANEMAQGETNVGKILTGGAKAIPAALALQAGLQATSSLAGKIASRKKTPTTFNTPEDVKRGIQGTLDDVKMMERAKAADPKLFAEMERNGKVMSPDPVTRARDIATKLDGWKPGTGKKFLKLVEGRKLTTEQLVSEANDFVDGVTITTPKIPGKPEGGIDAAVRSVEGRLEKLSPQTKKIAEQFREVDTRASISTGQTALQLKRTGINKLKQPELLDLTDALEGRLDPSKLSPNARPAYDFFVNLRGEVAQKAKDVKLKIRTSRGVDLDFAPRKNYIPHYIPKPEELAKGAVRGDVAENLVRQGFAKSKNEALTQINKYIEFQKSGGTANQDYFAQKLVDTAQAKTLDEAKGKIIRFFKASRQQRVGNLERAREINLPFYDPNPLRFITRYISSTKSRIASAEVFGPNFERADSLLGQIKNDDAQKIARNLVAVARKGIDAGDTTLNTALQTGRKVMTYRLNPLSSMTNLGQNINTLLATDVPTFFKAIVRSTTKDGKELPIEAGSLSEHVLNGVQRAAAAEGQSVGNYLKAIGFTGTEKINRTIATNAGLLWSQKMGKALVKDPNNKIARNELTLLGIDPNKVIKQGGVLSQDDLLRAAKNMAGNTQFLSRNIDLPAWVSQSELGKSVAQFKTFAYQQSRFIAKQTVDQFRAGNPGRAMRNIAIIATVYPLTGEAIADLRSLISGKKRESRGLQRYIENATMVGAFGILSDVISSLKYDPAQFVIGPTGAFITQNLKTAYEIFTKGVSDQNKRDLLRQVPGIGPILANRVTPSEPIKKNPNIGAGKEIIKTTEFGDVKIGKPEFRVDGQTVGLKSKFAKQYQADVLKAYTDSLSEASLVPGWKEKDNIEKKKSFDKIFNKKKSEIQDRWLKEGKLNPSSIAGEDRLTEGDSNPYKVVANYGKGILTDPEQTLRALFTKERLRDVVGPIGKGVVRLEREKFLSLLDKGDKGKVIDHIIPLTLGGTNDPSNLRVVDESVNKEKAKQEVRLLNLVKSGKITRKQAQEEILQYAGEKRKQKRSILDIILGVKEASAAELPKATDQKSKLANHIATLEGYKKTGTLADRQRNPGNLRFAGQKNAVRGEKGFAKFKTHQDGFNALIAQIKLDASRNLTLRQFIYKYAPPKENNTAAYLRSVSKSLGISPETKLKTVIK